MNAQTVTRRITLGLTANGTRYALPSALSYSAADPYAVRMDIGAGTGEDPVTWVFARGLLAGGLHGPSGGMDVRTRPSRDGQSLLITLCPQDGAAQVAGPAELTAPVADVLRFLNATYSLVPPGGEAAFLDIDSVIAGILPGGGTR